MEGDPNRAGAVGTGTAELMGHRERPGETGMGGDLTRVGAQTPSQPSGWSGAPGTRRPSQHTGGPTLLGHGEQHGGNRPAQGTGSTRPGDTGSCLRGPCPGAPCHACTGCARGCGVHRALPPLQTLMDAQNSRIEELLQKIKQQQYKLDKQNLQIKSLQSKVSSCAAPRSTTSSCPLQPAGTKHQ